MLTCYSTITYLYCIPYTVYNNIPIPIPNNITIPNLSQPIHYDYKNKKNILYIKALEIKFYEKQSQKPSTIYIPF